VKTKNGVAILHTLHTHQDHYCL